jgi:glycosyltransferase involved in cell wall biosynthesis
MKRIIHHSRFQANPFGHGGEKRTTQIIEKHADYEIVELEINLKKKTNIVYIAKALYIIFLVYSPFYWKSIRTFYRFWKKLSRILPQVEHFFKQDFEFFLWESTTPEFYFLPVIAKKHQLKTIAYPHNIESLVLNQSFSEYNSIQRTFIEEINILKYCDTVFAISRMDNQLLAVFEINTEYFPYNPPIAAQDFLLKIAAERKKRKPNTTKKILIIGTVHNPPTRQGMEILIKKINDIQVDMVEFSICGYGTNQLAPLIKTSKIILRGELSQEELEREMVNADAMLIYQPPTTGVLTRIMEFLIADIPIVINVEAAHSHYEMQNFHIYSTNEELVKILKEI